MKMLVLACLGATAAAIPFQQSGSTEAETLREFDALLAQQSEHELLLDAYATAQSDQTAAAYALNAIESGQYAAAHSAYTRAVQSAHSAQRNTDIRDRQATLERQIEVLRLEWRKLERSRELLDARAELETLEARQKMRLEQRERMRSLEVKCNDLESEAHAVDQLAEEVSADLERHLVEQLATAESERSQVLEDRRAELEDRLTARRAAGDEEINSLQTRLDQATANEEAADVRALEQLIEALATRLQHDMEMGEREGQLVIAETEAKLAAELRSRESDFEREIRHQRVQRDQRVREIEMQRRVLENRQEELDEQNDFAEERLVLERELARHERELAMETEMEHMEMIMERLERELERAEDRADEDEDDDCDDDCDEDCDEDDDSDDDGDDYRLVRDSYETSQAHIAAQKDRRFELVLEAIAGLRSDVDGLRRDVDKLMKRAESVR